MTNLLWLLLLGTVVAVCGTDLTLEKGHLKPFGEGRPSQPVEELDYFPSAEEFFENYVKPLKPVKMKGAAKMSSAFGKWTDDYFLAQDEADVHKVSVETKKKESREQDVESMSFKEFVSKYNHTEHYMVDGVPKYLRHEIMIPCPLQCEQLMDNDFVDNVMWYSSGGTKSVVHTDSVDNINCLYRGEKTLVFVDPSKYGDKVDIDKPQGAYSTMDVDSVDYTKFPGMSEVEFYHVDITAGDCLYIPYLWIHQVRSYGSNLAVNIWWKHHLSSDLDYTQCNDPCDTQLTLADAKFAGFTELARDPEEVKSQLRSFVGHGDGVKISKFVKNLLGDNLIVLLQNDDVKTSINEMFTLLDIDKNALLSRDDLDKVSDEAWSEVSDIMYSIEQDIGGYYDDENIDIDDGDDDENNSNNDDDDSDEMDLHEEL
ncbi:hypothetical protein ACF0H5_008419 [Mactra antiquata]